MIIRTATTDDAEAIARIYSPYVERTAITFDYEAPTPVDFEAKIARIEERHPFLVAEEDGAILAYAYASEFKDRPAYDRSVELSVYCDMEARGRGLGSALYAALESVLARQGVLNVNACIAFPASPDEFLDDASVRFHEARGYALVGTFHACGFKFDRWYDMVWMEKMLGEHTPEPVPFVPFSRLSIDEVAAAISARTR
ncbi:GNAT family N-acetyltransferase [Actinomyces culturomici]|uniref:GNAT family N-acetyltransferase n=1 Tax=Actinomyces culturomici TaxID=1926276 RepID=UPI000E1FFE7A|nr:GNAT family N-acetyltransferase [Actinomyces culturomici]